MYKVKFNNSHGIETISMDEPMRLDELLKQNDILVDMPCGGNHTCGKCKVKVKGHLSQMTESERKFLSDEDIKNDIRLACFAKVDGDIEVFPKQVETNVLSKIRLDGIKCTEEGYGIAADIGTTTVALQLYELATGTLISESLRKNIQGAFGADVISRIKYATENGTEHLKNVIQRQLKEMALECMKQGNVDAINKSVITGNTVMLHFYEGLETKNIAVAPFTPESLFGRMSSSELMDSQTYLPACIGSYVGADISCSILSAGMQYHDNKIELLADLGTNGELVLNHKGKLYCASTAAGPAFEGANLSCGMRADRGAITDVTVREGKFSIEVIGSGKAKGICGSGIIDAVSTMLEVEVIDETGKIDENYVGYGEVLLHQGEIAWKIPATEVYITQKDIREIQLAKSAIFAGIKTLLEQAEIEEKDVETFYVAGGFGYHMNGVKAAHIGLFPKGLEQCIEVIGNGALSGAIMLLLDNKREKHIEEIVKRSNEVVLSGNKGFSDYYIDGMFFEEDE